MKLDDNIAMNTRFVANLELCELRIQDEARFPWVMLIPRLKNVYEIIDLNEDEQQQLMREINLVSHAMKQTFDPDKLNVGALGNITRQLHIHIIARYEADLAWPNPVWGYFEQSTRYAEDALERRIVQLRSIVAPYE